MPLRVLRLSLIAWLLFAPPAFATAADWSLAQLMQQFAAIGHRQARFTETRELALLDSSLNSAGTLTFDAPDSLNKTYDPPDGRSYIITGNRLTIRGQDGREKIVLLDNSPQLLAYVDSLRAVLAGNLKRLQSDFETRLSGNAADWLLALTPRTPQQVQRIEITGRHTAVLQFTVIEQGGDRIVTRLHANDEK